MSDGYFYEVIPESEIEPEKLKIVRRCFEVCKEYFPNGTLPDFKLKWVRRTDEARYKSSEEPWQNIVEGLRSLFPEAGLKALDEKIFKVEGGEFAGCFKTKCEDEKINMTIFLRADLSSIRETAEVALHEIYHMLQYVRRGRGPCALDIAGQLQQDRAADEFAKRFL